MDTSTTTEDKKKEFIAVEEHNKNPIRVTPFDEIRSNMGNKCSGRSATCLNNCDKHLMMSALEGALMLCAEIEIEFKPSNFELLYKLLESGKYIQNDVFSDDALRHVHNRFKLYFYKRRL